MREYYSNFLAICKSYFTVVHNCTTVGGPDPGANCVFPFTYDGVVHTECVDFGLPKLLCATLTDQNGNYVKGNWGYCASNCTTKQGKLSNINMRQ